MHEAATLAAPEQLHMQTQPDMAAAEAKLPARAPEQMLTVDAGHHHVEEIHIDHPEDHGAIVASSHEAEHGGHEHVHDKGCGHVEYQDAAEQIDPIHEHNEHCGHVHHTKAEAHVDAGDCASGRCGHEHHHSKQVDAEIDHGKAHHHEHEAVAHSNNEAEQTTSQVVHEAEKTYRQQQLVDAQEQATPVRGVAEAIEITPPLDMIDRERAHIEQAQKYAKTAEVKTIPQVIADVATESIAATESESASTEEQSPATELMEQPQSLEVPTLEAETDQSAETVAEIVPEPSLLNVVETPHLETQLDTISELDEAAGFTPFKNFGIELVALPVFEPVAGAEVHIRPLAPTSEDDSTSQPEISASVDPSIDEALETLTTAIVERYDEIEEQLASVAPEQLEVAQKLLTNIKTELRLSREHGVMPENIQYQLIRLLQMLGFENPSLALTSYIQQYGISFVNELLARFFEFLGQGRSFESLRVLQPQITNDEDAGIYAKLGGAVLNLVSKLQLCHNELRMRAAFWLSA